MLTEKQSMYKHLCHDDSSPDPRYDTYNQSVYTRPTEATLNYEDSSKLKLQGLGSGQLHLRLLFILSSLFFKSSMLAVEEEDVVTVPEEWVWLESRSECWCCSRDSRS